ncbi:hypothetical protein TrCOL_g8617 [Triparma columacea]|uniref:OTU domain-containing protein n=1 Tax=Triparma columacea TaxID=722753 RepID=A0A9W7L8X0_9STRA|nr:hypothetical protein TrCOL_g8617 [Triparma columacea]
MSSLAATSLPPPTTTLKADLKALENERRAKVKKAKGAAGKNKAKQKEVEATINAIFDKKKAEIEAKYAASEVTDGMESVAISDDAGTSDSKPTSDPTHTSEPTIDPAAAKREKARLKKLKKKQKAKDEEAALADALNNAGPSNREVEVKDILSENKFAENNLKILDIEADGHCMYRAVGHCVSLPYEEVRSLAASALEENANDYAPFVADFDGDFQSYCDTVRNSAEWGSHLELQALSKKLEKSIKIYNSSPKPTIIGEEFSEQITVSYHRYYYDLGEHYNVVESSI